MAEYIEREKLADGLKEWQNRLIETYGENDEYVRCLNSVLFSVDNAPAADVRPVVRGHWIGEKEAEEMGDIMKSFTCSVCGACEWDCTESASFNFCPACGAEMREAR